MIYERQDITFFVIKHLFNLKNKFIIQKVIRACVLLILITKY